MTITARFEASHQEALTAWTENRNTSSLLEIRVMTLVFREQPALALIFHDVTERGIIEVLKYNNSYKDRLLASVAHELRTPLNASINLVQSAIDEHTISQKVKEELLIPSLDSNRLLLYLINDILDFSQMAANKLRLIF